MKVLSLTLFGSLLLGLTLQAEPATSAALTSAQLEQLNPSERIDHLIFGKLQEQKIEPNAGITDATFVRRAYLDIAGRVPTIEEAEMFHTMEYPNKREILINQLLNSEGYVSNYYNFWADVLRINSGLSTGARNAEAAYQLWVKRALRENVPYDEFVHEMVAAQGHIWENGAVGYYMRDRGMPLDNMSNTVRIFLGTRLECAQCHDHPFDKWTQMDYYKMAAFSYHVDANRYETPNRQLMSKYQSDERKRIYYEAVGIEGFPVFSSEDRVEKFTEHKNFQRYLDRYELNEKQFRKVAMRGVEAYNAYQKEDYQEMRNAMSQLYQRVRYISVGERERDLKLPHDYQYTDAKPFDVVSADTMFGSDINPENVDDLLEAYADWMTTPDNPTFTKVIANRLWKRVFGVGVFEPVDELTDHTQVSNPELMAYLEQLMKELDYDMKAYLEVLYNTEAYQRVADNGELVLGMPYYFQGPVLRRMSAEQIWDSIVALALPEADSYAPRIKSQLQGVEKMRQMYYALEGRTFEEYLAMVEELSTALEGNIPAQNEVRAKLYKAREEDDMDAYRQYRKELSELQREANQKVMEIGFRHTGEKIDADQLLAAVGMSEMTMQSMQPMQAMGQSMSQAEDNAVLVKLPKPKFPDMPEGLDKQQRKAWSDRQKAEYKVYTSLVAGMARASELESPARRGHFLREFGQSDREVIENAAYNASVPQALNLLNGPMVDALTNKFAVFGSRLHAAGDPQSKTEMIFQAMLTRQPTEREMAIALAEIEQHGDAAYEGLVWSLLNTQQFLFIQ